MGLNQYSSNGIRHTFVFPMDLIGTPGNPASDSNLTALYTASEAQEAKTTNRTSLRKEFGLTDDPEVPLIGIVSRLVDQKGFDLIAAIADELRKLPLQLVVLGTGHPQYESLFLGLRSQNSSCTSTDWLRRCAFPSHLCRRNFFLMPSMFEPGGLGQLIALRYGTLPIVHATGGLADTVIDVYDDPVSRQWHQLCRIHAPGTA